MGLLIDEKICDACGICIGHCPFGALEILSGRLAVKDTCRLCRLCIKSCPRSAIMLEEIRQRDIDKPGWQGVMVVGEQYDGVLHPVTRELIGEARVLAGETQPVYCMLIGGDVRACAGEVLQYGVNEVFTYENPAFNYFIADVYANVCEDCILKIKPNIVLIGATPLGRSLAPRLSTRFRTGLTADCTQLGIKPDGDLIQIRPAFGGNIMARIVTPRSRPQFATVRYKVMQPAGVVEKTGRILRMPVKKQWLASGMSILDVYRMPPQLNISDCDVLVVAGRGVKEQKDIAMIEELARLLNGQMACTRPMVEAGWVSYLRQIGLSGRTVKPKLIITCGVSGAVQFTACMEGSECIIAINKDPEAGIFRVAHYALVGDLYEIIPRLIQNIEEGLHASK